MQKEECCLVDGWRMFADDGVSSTQEYEETQTQN